MLFILFGKDSAFKEHDFRLFFYGQAISSIGTWLQSAALGWLIFQLTHSEFAVGLNGAFMVAPAILLAPIAGVLIDAFKTKHILIITNVLGMLQASALALLVLIHQPSLWEINLLTLMLGIINAFDGPARHASIAEIVPLEDIPSATALNSTLVSAGIMLGTAFAGLIIWLAGTGITFLINALSFVPVIITVLMLQFNYAAIKHANGSWRQILPGFKYAFVENKALRSLLILIFLSMTFGFPYRTLMPAIAKVLFHGNAMVFGMLGAMPGFGAVIAGIIISRYSKRIAFKNFVIGGCSLLGTCLIAFSLTRNIYTALPLLFLAGFGAVTSTSMLRAKAQMIGKGSLLGRVTSFNMMVFLGGVAFGNTAVGQLAQRVGLTLALCICGLALLSMGAFLILFPQTMKRFE